MTQSSHRSNRLPWQRALLLSIMAGSLAACGGGGGGSASGSTDPALAAQINEVKPTDNSVVPVFVELSGSTAAGAADTVTDPDARRRLLQQQFVADLKSAVAQPATAAGTSSTCDAASLAQRLNDAFMPSSGAAVRIELSACELDLLPKLSNVKGVHADIPLDLNASADANALALEVQRSFDGMGSTNAIANGTTTAWPAFTTNGSSTKADGTGYVIAVLDTGVEDRHPALSGKVLPGACFSSTTSTSTGLCPLSPGSSTPPNTDTTSVNAGRSCGDSSAWSGDRAAAIRAGCFHGTSMAGVAAMDYSRTSGSGNAAHGGVAKGAKILPIQVFSKTTNSSSVGSTASDLLAAIEWLTTQADALRTNGKTVVALNMSLGGGSYTSACDSAYVGGLFKTAFDNLRAKGILPVVAAGNDGNQGAVSFPACVSNAVTVAAAKLGYNGIASYSNFNSQVKLFAPGGDRDGMYAMPTLCANTTGDNDCWSQNAGTSPATAFVSGAVAALKSAKSTATLTEIEAALTADLAATYPTLAKNLSVNGVTRPALRVTASAYRLLGLPAPNTPAPTTFTIGGTVTGLASNASLTLLNNGVDTLTVQTNGGFAFATPVTNYNVTVGTQPSGQTCSVSNRNGTATSNVTNVSVTCTTNSSGGSGGESAGGGSSSSNCSTVGGVEICTPDDPTTISFNELCVYSQKDYVGMSACAFWDGTSTNVYGFYGAIKSMRVQKVTWNVKTYTKVSSLPSSRPFTVTLTPWSSKVKLLELSSNTADVGAVWSAQGLPANGLVRQVKIARTP